MPSRVTDSEYCSHRNVSLPNGMLCYIVWVPKRKQEVCCTCSDADPLTIEGVKHDACAAATQLRLITCTTFRLCCYRQPADQRTEARNTRGQSKNTAANSFSLRCSQICDKDCVACCENCLEASRSRLIIRRFLHSATSISHHLTVRLKRIDGRRQTVRRLFAQARSMR